MTEDLQKFISACINARLTSFEILRLVRLAIAEEAIKRADGNKCRAARMLGIHRNNISRWYAK